MAEESTTGSQDRSALTALLKIFFFVVLSNVVLYLAIVYFAVVTFQRNVPLFLAFIQFLAFILPIALILRLGLREAPAAVPIENAFLKKMGATPTLVVLSSLAAFFATFTPLGAQIFPRPDPTTALVAKVGVACRIESDNSASKGAYFLTLVWSDDTDYITKVRSEIRSLQEGGAARESSKPPLYRIAEKLLAQAFESIGLIGGGPKLASGDASFAQIKFVQKADAFYKLLKQDPLASKESHDLRTFLSDDLRWVAFTTPVGEPESYTQVPIYTRFGRRNHTRVYLITFSDEVGPKNVSGDPLQAAAEISNRSSAGLKFEIRKVSEVEILPHPPESETQKAELNVVVFPTKSCWTKAPVDTL